MLTDTNKADNHHEGHALLADLGYYHYQCEVTPEIAAKWLGAQVRNRPLKVKIVTRYASEMAAGNWRVTGEPIKFDKAGHLIDGQHRLQAVIKAGVSVAMDIRTGIDAEAQDYMDRGLGRTAADLFAMHGETQPVLVAAIARLLWIYLKVGLENEHNMVSPPPSFELLETLYHHPGIRHSANETRRYDEAQKLLPPSVVGFTHYLTSTINLAKSEDFWAKLDSGANLAVGHPILTLRKSLSQNRDSKSQYPKIHKLAILFKTWNYYYAGRSVFYLRWQTEGTKVEEFPKLSGMPIMVP